MSQSSSIEDITLTTSTTTPSDLERDRVLQGHLDSSVTTTPATTTPGDLNRHFLQTEFYTDHIALTDSDWHSRPMYILRHRTSPTTSGVSPTSVCGGACVRRQHTLSSFFRRGYPLLATLPFPWPRPHSRRTIIQASFSAPLSQTTKVAGPDLHNKSSSTPLTADQHHWLYEASEAERALKLACIIVQRMQNK